ncbi:MAG: hypothetical protein WC580_02975 [Agrococcus sp.]
MKATSNAAIASSIPEAKSAASNWPTASVSRFERSKCRASVTPMP